jgi:hypothetical protein
MRSASKSIMWDTERKAMDHKNRKRNDAMNHYSIPASEKDFNHEQPKNIGWLMKFLDWISKGAAKSSMGTMDCPT